MEPSDPIALFSLNINGGAVTAKRRHTLPRRRHHSHDLNAHRRLATPSHLLIPGAPPASKPANTLLRAPTSGKASAVTGEQNGVDVFETCVVPPTPRPGACNGVFSPASNHSGKVDYFRENMDSPDSSNESSELQSLTQDSGEEDNGVGLLPDEKWIAVICGVSKEQWNAENEEGELPEGFYVAPRDVYMPDLIAVGDVVLGKLVSFLVSCADSIFLGVHALVGVWDDIGMRGWLYTFCLWYVHFLLAGLFHSTRYYMHSFKAALHRRARTPNVP